MDSIKFKNYVLKKLLQSKELFIDDIADEISSTLSQDEINKVKNDLILDGYVETKKISQFLIAIFITEKGKNFISKGGYKTVMIEEAELLLNTSIGTMSKIRQSNKGKNEKKNFLKSIQEIYDSIYNRLGVMSAKETDPIFSKLEVLLERYFGKLSFEFIHFKKIIDEKKEHQELVPFLAREIARVEHDLQGTNNFPISNPILIHECKTLFLDGHYDEMVFTAFKTIEIMIKNKTGSSEVGVKLLRGAFAPQSGSLQLSSHSGEQSAIMELYTGAFGSIRNKQGHNKVNYTLEQATELLYLANLLITWIEKPNAYEDYFK